MTAKVFALRSGCFGVAFSLALVTGVALAPVAHAADFTVLNGDVVGAQYLSDPGNLGRVNAGGTISTSGGGIHGVVMAVGDQELDNSGSISTTGAGAIGIFSNGANAEITSSGSISTAASSSQGIISTGANADITISGSLSAAGDSGHGIFAAGADADITISGSLSTTGAGAHGIASQATGAEINISGILTTTGVGAIGVYSDALGVEITNSGSVSTAAATSHGIISAGGDAVINNLGSLSTAGGGAHSIVSFAAGVEINNSGSLSTTGAAGHGIASIGANAEIINSGNILATGVDARGVFSSGANGQVTNSGRIVSLQSNAIEFSGNQDNRLTLLPGSVIQGGILLGGGSDTLVIGKGLSIDITFDKRPEVIDAQGAPYVVSGTRVTTQTRVITVDTADLDGLVSQGEQLADMTGGFSWLLEDRLSALRNPGWGNLLAGRGGAGAMYQTASLEALNDAGPAADSGPNHPFWVQSFGSYRRHEAGGSQLGTAQLLNGLLAGADQLFEDDIRAGAFVGASWGHSRVLEGSQENETRGAIAGAYASLQREGLIFDFALSGGYNAIEQTRDVVNSQVSGGLETAKADYGGWFVSPEMRVTMPTTLLGHAAEPSLLLRYAGLFLEDYTEKEVAAPLSVEARDLHMGVARLQIASPDETAFENGDILRYRFKAGAELRRSFGDDRINAVLLNQSLSFESGDDKSTLGGFAGISGEYDNGSGMVFFLSTEGLLESGGSYQLSGQAGFKFSL